MTFLKPFSLQDLNTFNLPNCILFLQNLAQLTTHVRTVKELNPIILNQNDCISLVGKHRLFR